MAGGTWVGDGETAERALLGQPEGLAYDREGNLYIADAMDHRIRRVSASGTIASLAGDGVSGLQGDGGAAAVARFASPYDVAVDWTGSVYVADLGNARIRKIDRSGRISTVAGGGEQTPATGLPATQVKLNAPRNVAVDASGNLLFSDFGAHQVWRITPQGTLDLVAGTGKAGFSGDGSPAAQAQLTAPAGLAVDRAGAVYIADSGNARIRKIANNVISTVTVTSPEKWVLGSPTSVAVDTLGTLYVGDPTEAHGWRITSKGIAEAFGASLRSVAVDPLNRIVVSSQRRILRMEDTTWRALAGSGQYENAGDGQSALQAHLWQPMQLTADVVGNIYVADAANHRIRRIEKSGKIFNVAGSGEQGDDDGKGDPLRARFSQPSGLALDPTGALYIADTGNGKIRKLTRKGELSTLYGGPATTDFLRKPTSLAWDASGTLYIADTANHRVVRLLANGRLERVAGTGAPGFSGDGGRATQADMTQPSGLMLDKEGNLSIACEETQTIRRVDKKGIISTVADAIPAHWKGPAAVSLDAQGTLWVADRIGNRILAYDQDGTVRRVAGTGEAGWSSDAADATKATFTSPQGILALEDGRVLVADTGNNLIRVLVPVEEATPPVVLPPAAVVVSQARLVHGATGKEEPVAPGQVAMVRGTGIGALPTPGALTTEGLLATTLAGLEVRLNNIAAPIFQVREDEITVQVPNGLLGQTTATLEVLAQGQRRASFTAQIAARVPRLLTEGDGSTQALAVNEEGTLNSARNPALRGSVITLYVTGEGTVSPARVDGKAAAEPYPQPTEPVVVDVAGFRADVLYAGAAPGLLGVMQVNARLPSGFAPSGTLLLRLTVGAASSQAGVTISVR